MRRLVFVFCIVLTAFELVSASTDCRGYKTPVQSTKNGKETNEPLARGAASKKKKPPTPKGDGAISSCQGGVCFFLKPLMLSSTLDTLDALEEATELGALLLFPAGACLCGITACGISQPDSELACELGWGGAMASTAGMHHWAATSGSMAPPPKDSVSAHASGETGPALPAAGTNVRLRTVGLRLRSPTP